MIYFRYNLFNGQTFSNIEGIVGGLGMYNNIFFGTSETADLLNLINDYNPIEISYEVFKGLPLVDINTISEHILESGSRIERPFTSDEELCRSIAIDYLENL